jgi:hypothetical protein
MINYSFVIVDELQNIKKMAIYNPNSHLFTIRFSYGSIITLGWVLDRETFQSMRSFFLDP